MNKDRRSLISTALACLAAPFLMSRRATAAHETSSSSDSTQDYSVTPSTKEPEAGLWAYRYKDGPVGDWAGWVVDDHNHCAGFIDTEGLLWFNLAWCRGECDEIAAIDPPVELAEMPAWRQFDLVNFPEDFVDGVRIAGRGSKPICYGGIC